MIALTWLRIDDRFAEHPKVQELSDSAFRAHVAAMCWCARQETDGKIPKKASGAFSKPRHRRELVLAGLWDEIEGGYEIHDYLKYNPSHAQLEAKRRATSDRVNAHRNRVGNGVTGAVTNRRTNGVSNTTPDPVPDPEGIPPTPLSDPMGDALRGNLPGDRRDVRSLFERFKTAVALPGLSLRRRDSLDAETLAEALDAHGWADCALVADTCASDRMVTGEADEKGIDHKSVKYVFGNATAFARILAAAKKSKAGKKPAGSTMAKALAAEPDLTGTEWDTGTQ